jgi:probable blue pigment (indigoidine) exporter
MTSRIERSAFGAGLLACLSWACGTVLSKSLLDRFHPLDLLVMQLGISTALLWVLAITYRRIPDFHDWRFAWPGVLQPGLAYGLSIFGLAAIPASLETMLFAAESALTLVLAWPLLGERPRPAFIGLTAIAFGGVALLSWDGQSISATGPIAIAFVLAGVTCASLYSVTVKHLVPESNILTVTTTSQSSGLTLIIIAWMIYHGDILQTFETADIPLIAASGLLLYAIPFLLYNFMLQKLNAGTASLMLPLVPILTAIIARWFLGETMSGFQWIGGAAVLCATGSLVLLGDYASPPKCTEPAE